MNNSMNHISVAQMVILVIAQQFVFIIHFSHTESNLLWEAEHLLTQPLLYYDPHCFLLFT